MSKKVVKKSENAVSTSFMMDLEADSKAGGGLDNIRPEDVALPFIQVLQALSPIVQDQVIEGAKQGDFYNTVTGEIYKKISLIPCAHKVAWIEWQTRDNGGAFVAQHNSESILDTTKKDEKNRSITKNGTQIVFTHYFFCILVHEDGKHERVIVTFASTQIKKARKWLSQLLTLQIKKSDGTTFRAPMFSHVFSCATVKESNKIGVWAGWSIESPVMIEDQNLYMVARQFSLDVNKGKIKIGEPKGTAPDVAEDVTEDSNIL